MKPVLKISVAFLLLAAIVAFRFKPGGEPLLSFVSYEGQLFTEVMIENGTDHEVRIDYYPGRSPSPEGSFMVGARHRVPLQSYPRRDTEPPIDSPDLFFRVPYLDSFVVVFDGRHRVAHYVHAVPAKPSAKQLVPRENRNLGWIGSWDYQRYRDPVNAKLIDGFRYTITETDFQYAGM